MMTKLTKIALEIVQKTNLENDRKCYEMEPKSKQNEVQNCSQNDTLDAPDGQDAPSEPHEAKIDRK